MSKSSKAMDKPNIPSFTFGSTAVIRPLPGGTREVIRNDTSLRQLKENSAGKGSVADASNKSVGSKPSKG